MSQEELKINIEGLLIDLTEDDKAILVVHTYYIKVYQFYTDISDYLMTLYDYLSALKFTDLEFTYFDEVSYTAVRLDLDKIKDVRKMGIDNIDLYFTKPIQKNSPFFV